MTLFSVAFDGDRALHEYPELARIAENYNFFSFQVYEHLPLKPAWPIVFHTSPHLKRLLIGPVTVPAFVYDPVNLARNLATLHWLTNGRAILGISRGGYAEFMPRPVDRSMRATLESVECLEAILNARTYKGNIYQYEKHQRIEWLESTLAGMQQPLIYVGTSGSKLASRACKIGLVKGIIVDLLWNPRYATQLRKVLDDATSDAGREKLSLIARPFTLVSRSRREARMAIEPVLRSYVPSLVGDSPMLTSAGVSYDDIMSKEKRGRQMDAMVENFAATGTPSDVVEQTGEMLRAGVDHVCFGHPLGVTPSESIHMLGEEVLPHFPEASAKL